MKKNVWISITGVLQKIREYLCGLLRGRCKDAWCLWKSIVVEETSFNENRSPFKIIVAPFSTSFCWRLRVVLRCRCCSLARRVVGNVFFFTGAEVAINAGGERVEEEEEAAGIG